MADSRADEFVIPATVKLKVEMTNLKLYPDKYKFTKILMYRH